MPAYNVMHISVTRRDEHGKPADSRLLDRITVYADDLAEATRLGAESLGVPASELSVEINPYVYVPTDEEMWALKAQFQEELKAAGTDQWDDE